LKGLIGSGQSRQQKTASNPPEIASKNRLSTANLESPTLADSPISPGTTGAKGSSAVSQIGTPDFAGFMKKKGERYNTWKTRYFVLKGPHLYYMKDETVSVWNVFATHDERQHRLIAYCFYAALPLPGRSCQGPH
jgi:hypothetical protein